MDQYQRVFLRYEKKYLLTPAQHAQVAARLRAHMRPDQYGRHTICNLYYDTDSFDIIRASIQSPIYKEKLRLRSYGCPAACDTVFLELKKKHKGVVGKRRVPLTLSEAMRYLQAGQRPSEDGQILREIDWHLAAYGPGPKAFIAYERTAFISDFDPSLRVTFDSDLRFRTDALDLSAGAFGQAMLERPLVLMEIKTAGGMPLWLARTLSELGLFARSFSKYGYCYENHILYSAGRRYCA